MVAWRKIVRFAKGEQGSVLIEGLIVFPLLMLVFATMVEFGVTVFQYNQTAKAMQLGARLAAVSDPLLPSMSEFTEDYPDQQGGPTPTDAVSVSCGAGATPCDATRMARLVRGSDGVCDPNYGTSLPGVCDFNPRIGADNLLITYSRSGLGYVGRPDGPVVTVTLESRNLEFATFFLGPLLGIAQITIPAQPVTVTSEDLSSCKSICP